jgi:hypothetical protein
MQTKKLVLERLSFLACFEEATKKAEPIFI